MNWDIHPSIWLQPFMLLQSSRDASPLSRKSQQTIRHFFLNGTWEPAINSLLFYERSAPAFLINNPEPHFSSINVAQRPPSEQEHVNGAEKGKKGEKQQYTQAARISRFFFFFFSLWISGVCTSGLFTALGVQQILRWLRFLFDRFHDQAANGGCDQDSKEAPPLENTQRAELSL